LIMRYVAITVPLLTTLCFALTKQQIRFLKYWIWQETKAFYRNQFRQNSYDFDVAEI
jgi:hypothetical protein